MMCFSCDKTRRGRWRPVSTLYVRAGLLVLLAGCTTIESLPTSAPETPRASSGVYHKIRKGETLWRVSQIYQVDIDDLIRSNNIPDVARVEENQLIYIPGAKEVRSTAPDTAVKVSTKDDFGWPIRGRILYYFGERRGSYLNRGIGIEAAEGQPVLASRPGKVVFSDYLAGYAHTVILDHQDGYFSVYALNSRLTVNLGDIVSKGDQLALAGKKGDTAVLYFQICRRATPENPLFYLPKL